MFLSNLSENLSTGLVHRRLALIAAHCLPQDEEQASIKIRFTLPDKKTTDIKVIDWEAHPDQDLALLELASDAPSSVEILYLPNADQTFNPQTIEVAGYGDITGEVDKDGKSGILRQVSLDIVSYDRDSREIRVDQSRGKGFCIGDSGAPGIIMKENGYPALIGIATETRGASQNNRCDKSGYLVNLSLYLDWIYQAGREIQARTSHPANQLQ